MPAHAWLDGRVVPFAEACVPLDDRGLQFGESLYEVVAVTASKARLLPEHVSRMRRAAAELGLARGVPPLEEWERIVADLIAKESASESVLYAQVTGGSSPRRHIPHEVPSPTFFAYLTAHRMPRAADVERGIRVVTLADARWRRCDLKTTMLLPAVLAKKEAAQHGADEALLMDEDGHLREGASSNVTVVEHGALVTPAQSSRLLPGTMRAWVEEVASEAGVVVESGHVSRERLLRADEVFITSTTQLVMPVVAIDGARVGTGRAGPVATDLATRVRTHYELE